MDARIGELMREGRTVYYAFADGYDKPAFEGTLEAVERRLGLLDEKPRGQQSTSKLGGRQVKSWVVTMRFEYPAWDEKDGIRYEGVLGRTKAEANRAAARMAAGDGHACSGRGRYWFTATSDE
jgi:hypothetical protein